MTQLSLLGSPSSFPSLPQRWDDDTVSWGTWQEHVRSSADFHGDLRACEPSQGEVFDITTRPTNTKHPAALAADERP